MKLFTQAVEVLCFLAMFVCAFSGDIALTVAFGFASLIYDGD